jgi:hypothetical protein
MAANPKKFFTGILASEVGSARAIEASAVDAQAVYASTTGLGYAIVAQSQNGVGLFANNTNAANANPAVSGLTSSTTVALQGVSSHASDGRGVYGFGTTYGVTGETSGIAGNVATAVGVTGTNTGRGRAAIFQATSTSNAENAVSVSNVGTASTGNGLSATAIGGSAVVAASTNGVGVAASSTNSNAVSATTTTTTAVVATATSGQSLVGTSSSNNGITGQANTTTPTPGVAGLKGIDSGANTGTADGVYGQTSGSGAAVHGKVTGTGATGRVALLEQTVAANTADALVVTQVGSGSGINVSSSAGTQAAITLTNGGTGAGLNATTAGTSASINATITSTTAGALTATVNNASNANPAIYATSNGASGYAMQGITTATGAVAVNGAASLNGTGVKGTSGTGIGGYFVSTSGTPLYATTNGGSSSVYGDSSSNTAGGVGVLGQGNAGNGVQGSSVTGNGIAGQANTTTSTPGVAGLKGTDNGATTGTADGVLGLILGTGAAVHGKSTSGSTGGRAGYFENTHSANVAECVYAVHSGAGTSVYGLSSSGIGVKGAANGAGTGVSAIANATGTALNAAATSGRAIFATTASGTETIYAIDNVAGTSSTTVAYFQNYGSGIVLKASATGTGKAANLEQTNASNTVEAVLVNNAGTAGGAHGVKVTTAGGSSFLAVANGAAGQAGLYVQDASSSSVVNGVYATLTGSGTPLTAKTSGAANAAIIQNTGTTNVVPALSLSHFGTGTAATGLSAAAQGGTAILGIANTTTNAGKAGVWGTDNSLSTGIADGVYGQTSGSGAAMHGKVTGTGAVGKAGFFEQAVAANGTEAVVVTQAGTGSGLTVTSTNSANASALIYSSQAGNGYGGLFQVTSANGSIGVFGTVSATAPTVANYGLKGTSSGTSGVVGAGVQGTDNGSASNTGDGVYGLIAGSGNGVHGKSTGSGRAGYFEGTVAATGLATLGGGATLANGKAASSIVLFGSAARVINGVTIAAGWQYIGAEVTLTSYGVSCTIPHDAVALIGNFTTVPNASSANGNFFTVLPGNLSGAPGAVTANGGVNATVANGGNGLASYFPGIWPLGIVPSGTYINTKGFYIFGQTTFLMYFDCFGYVTA